MQQFCVCQRRSSQEWNEQIELRTFQVYITLADSCIWGVVFLWSSLLWRPKSNLVLVAVHLWLQRMCLGKWWGQISDKVSVCGSVSLGLLSREGLRMGSQMALASSWVKGGVPVSERMMQGTRACGWLYGPRSAPVRSAGGPWGWGLCKEQRRCSAGRFCILCFWKLSPKSLHPFIISDQMMKAACRRKAHCEEASGAQV